MKKFRTPITEKEWQELTAGDKIVDTYGRAWLVHGWNNNKTWLDASCPEYGSTKLRWEEHQILDEEYGIVIELNQSPIKIIKAEKI